MNYQDNFAISMLSMLLLKQHNTLDDMGTKLLGLAERADSVGGQQQHLDDCLTKLGQELAVVDAKVRSHMVCVDGQQLCTNMLLWKLVEAIRKHREALGHVAARVDDVSDRVDSMAVPKRQSDHSARVEGSPPKRAVMLERAAKRRRLARKRPFGRGQSGKRS